MLDYLENNFGERALNGDAEQEKILR
jgi:hypothetical protein